MQGKYRYFNNALRLHVPCTRSHTRVLFHKIYVRCLLLVGLWSKEILNDHDELKRWEKRSYGCENITASNVKTCPSPSKPHPAPAFQGIISPGGGEKPKEQQLLNSGFCKQPKDNLLLPRPLKGGKIPFNFLSLHSLFERPHTFRALK